MDLSQISNFGGPQNQNPYSVPEPGINKNLKWLIIGGVLLIIALIYLMFFTGGSKKGQPEMLETLQAKSEAIAVMEDYNDGIELSSLKNDLALSLILLRGNYQTMSDLYLKTFSKAEKPPTTPKLDETTKETMDRAKRNNVLDSEIIKVLKSKLSKAQVELVKAKVHFTKPSSRQVITKTQQDLEAIQDILSKPDLI